MNKVILLHGTGASAMHYWFPYIKESLSREIYDVSAPELPNTNKADIKEWLPFVLENFSFDESTILVGHSAGCPLILSVLENIDQCIKKAILVSGFCSPLGTEPELILQKSYNWEKIKQHAKEFVFVNSIDDPWGCNDKQGKFMFEKLGGDLIIRSDQGHMGSVKFNQPYKEFPLVKYLIEN